MKPVINSLKLAQWLSFLEPFHFILLVLVYKGHYPFASQEWLLPFYQDEVLAQKGGATLG
jgi:hypothetical protein